MSPLPNDNQLVLPIVLAVVAVVVLLAVVLIGVVVGLLYYKKKQGGLSLTTSQTAQRMDLYGLLAC